MFSRTFTDPGGPEATGNYSALIDWGDGSSSTGVIAPSGATSFGVIGNHFYAEEGNFFGPSPTYMITVTRRTSSRSPGAMPTPLVGRTQSRW